MTTMAKAKRKRTIKWLLIFAVLIGLYIVLTSTKIGALVEALTPPVLPERVAVNEQVWLDQNWEESTRDKYHHISQGTRTLPIPYQWFMNLEKPSSSLLGILFSSDKNLAENDYLLRFGFIEGGESAHNPEGLPIGFAITPNQNLAGFNERVDTLGFTCAGCHTGQIVHNKKQYVIDGGPATTDLGQFTKALGAALGQTALSSKLPVFSGRFDRFARNVLGNQYSDANKALLSEQLSTLVAAGAKSADIIDVQEGFTRLDALNRIGNQVFHQDIERPGNYAPIDAPVNYPHIWTSSWFDWVQYDGSIMNPLIRNAGEALGVNAYLDLKSPLDQGRFSSSVPIRDLYWIEQQLGGEKFGQGIKYTGLEAPKWPDSFGKPNKTLADKGEALYKAHCQGCHLPPMDSPEIWDSKHFGPIVWKDINGQEKTTSESVLHVKLIPQKEIGTDPAQGNVLVQRMVNTSGQDNVPQPEVTPGMGLNTILCTQAPESPKAPKDGYTNELVTVPFSDGGNVLFALALGATVEQTIEAWFKDNYISPEDQKIFYEDRPNCLQAGAGYRARPLNGVWATAPFLHNGSVPNLKALLSPYEQRPNLVQLGSTRIDIDNVGVWQDPSLEMTVGKNYAENGIFILDTSLPGNSNKGHEFSSAYIMGADYNQQPTGVIGPELKDDERLALIEYLKTL